LADYDPGDFENVKDTDSGKQRRILSSELYQDTKETLTKVAYGIILLIALYGLWRLFNFWFFAGLVISAMPLGILITHITQVPRLLVLSMHIAENEDDADYFAIYSIPYKMLELFKREGGDFYYLTTLEGTQIATCDSIDFENFRIKNSWFNEISNIEFFREKQAFLTLKQMYVDEIKANGLSRSLHTAMVYSHVQLELKKHYDKFDKVMSEPSVESEDLVGEIIRSFENITKPAEKAVINEADIV